METPEDRTPGVCFAVRTVGIPRGWCAFLERVKGRLLEQVAHWSERSARGEEGAGGEG